jgi:hypothetical protein
MVRFRIIAATTFVLVAATAFAQKTDSIVLRNGDKFTGEVKQLSRGQLRLSTDDVGTIYVEWDKIVAVTTAGRYEVSTKASERYVGTIASDTPATLQVIAEDGTVTRLAFVDVVSFSAIKSGFFERIDGSVDVGGSYTKSSGVGQASLAFDGAYRRPAFEVFAYFEGNLTRQQEAPSTSRFTFQTGYRRFRHQWFVAPIGFLERNPDLGLTLRSALALSLGRFLNQSAHNTTVMSVGIAAGRERLTEGETIANLDALMTFGTSFYRYDYPRRNLDLTVLVFPELNHWGRVRANLNAKFKQELFKDLFASVTVYDTFDSEPQVEDVHQNDFGVTFSLGWVF